MALNFGKCVCDHFYKMTFHQNILALSQLKFLINGNLQKRFFNFIKINIKSWSEQKKGPFYSRWLRLMVSGIKVLCVYFPESVLFSGAAINAQNPVISAELSQCIGQLRPTLVRMTRPENGDYGKKWWLV